MGVTDFLAIYDEVMQNMDLKDCWDRTWKVNPELDKISSKDIDPECAKLIDKYFWELT